MQKQEVIFYFDDSGVLHQNSKERYFIYAGYVFLSRKFRNHASRRYRNLIQSIRPHSKDKEVKASHLNDKTKRYLTKKFSEYDSVSCVVDKTHVYNTILENKLSLRRFKDYCLKRTVKAKLQELILKGKLNTNLPVNLWVQIDNQARSTNGLYNLRESIYEELQHGINSFTPVFKGEINVFVTYCDSSQHYLIQASDILANSIFCHLNRDLQLNFNPALHTQLHLP